MVSLLCQARHKYEIVPYIRYMPSMAMYVHCTTPPSAMIAAAGDQLAALVLSIGCNKWMSFIASKDDEERSKRSNASAIPPP